MSVPAGSVKAQNALSFLREKISSGEWPVNSRIPKEPELMELMGVGKSTVREAVRSLASVGMLEPIRGVGTFVRARTPVTSLLTSFLAEHSPAEILDYRRALEIEAAQQAAMNRTEKHLQQLRDSYSWDVDAEDFPSETPERGFAPGPFHHLIFEAAGNSLIASLYAGVMASLRQARNRGDLIRGTDHHGRHADHGEILRAVEERDVTAAAHAMAMHVERDLVLASAPEVMTPRLEALLALDA